MTAVLSPAPAGWQRRAACARPGIDPEWFFPVPGGSGKRAKGVCARCPVTAPCLADALDRPAEADHGVRGGLTAPQRRRLRRAPRGQGGAELGGRAR